MAKIAILCIGLALNSWAGAADTSELWGISGERWNPNSRLPDFSFAGYRSGSERIPDLPVKGSVKDFGAVGDGTADDTAAFLKAIAAVHDGALFIPAGRYRLTQPLKIAKSRFAFRGEGPEKTILFFAKPLKEASSAPPPAGSWSWSGGLISFEGDNADDLLASVVLPAGRGSRELTVGSIEGLTPGDTIRLVQVDRDGGLGIALYGGQGPSPRGFRKRKLVDFSSRIRSIRGKTLILERPVRIDVQPAWKPGIYSEVPTVKEVGVEDLRIEFPAVRYAGHHEEPGFNALEFSQIADGWVRRVTIVNADNGIFLRDGTKRCTLDNVRLTASEERARVGYGADKGEPQNVPVVGHHGILMTGLSQDNVVTNFRIEGRFVHDLGVENASAGNVFSKGQGTDLNFDHHRRAPYENLFTEIDAGEGTRLWEYGGDESDGPPSGARETFWNIRTSDAQPFPRWALQTNVIGVTMSRSKSLVPAGSWLEAIAPERVNPSNLYAAQRTLRERR